jgi:hypothetical protein
LQLQVDLILSTKSFAEKNFNRLWTGNFYEKYLAYREDYPRYTGPFTGEMGTVRVIEYHPECSIIQAKYTYIGLSGGAYFYLLHRQNGSWQVIDRAPAWKLRDYDWENARLPNPYSCKSE